MLQQLSSKEIEIIQLQIKKLQIMLVLPVNSSSKNCTMPQSPCHDFQNSWPPSLISSYNSGVSDFLFSRRPFHCTRLLKPIIPFPPVLATTVPPTCQLHRLHVDFFHHWNGFFHSTSIFLHPSLGKHKSFLGFHSP